MFSLQFQYLFLHIAEKQYDENIITEENFDNTKKKNIEILQNRELKFFNIFSVNKLLKNVIKTKIKTENYIKNREGILKFQTAV